VAKRQNNKDTAKPASDAPGSNVRQQLVTKTTKAIAYPDEATVKIGESTVLEVTFNTEAAEPLVCQVTVAFEGDFTGTPQKDYENFVPGFVKAHDVVKGKGNKATFKFTQGLLEDMQKAGRRVARLSVDTQVLKPQPGPLVTQFLDVKIPVKKQSASSS
jgi:hypothetical protein